MTRHQRELPTKESSSGIEWSSRTVKTHERSGFHSVNWNVSPSVMSPSLCFVSADILLLVLSKYDFNAPLIHFLFLILLLGFMSLSWISLWACLYDALQPVPVALGKPNLRIDSITMSPWLTFTKCIFKNADFFAQYLQKPYFEYGSTFRVWFSICVCVCGGGVLLWRPEGLVDDSSGGTLSNLKKK